MSTVQQVYQQLEYSTELVDQATDMVDQATINHVTYRQTSATLEKSIGAVQSHDGIADTPDTPDMPDTSNTSEKPNNTSNTAETMAEMPNNTSHTVGIVAEMPNAELPNITSNTAPILAETLDIKIPIGIIKLPPCPSYQQVMKGVCKGWLNIWKLWWGRPDSCQQDTREDIIRWVFDNLLQTVQTNTDFHALINEYMQNGLQIKRENHFKATGQSILNNFFQFTQRPQ